MNDSSSKPVSVRERAALVASLIGMVGVALGAVAGLWQGDLSALSAPALIVGGLALVAWVALDPQAALAVVRRRRIQHSTLTVLGIAVLLALTVSVYTAAVRANIVVDLTDSRQYSLSPETREILSRLDRPVRITAFYSARQLPRRERDDQFFRLYTTATDGLIELEFIDPTTNNAIAEAFGVAFDGDVFVSYLTDDGQIDFDTVVRVLRESTQERDMTGALLRLLQVNRFTVAFEIGYSTVSQFDTSETGLSAVIQGLERSGVITGAINLRELIANDGFIPDTVTALVLTQMREDLPPAAVEIIADYVDRGGSLLVMTDPDLLNPARQFLATDGPFNRYLWSTFGLRALDGVVVDPVVSGRTPLDVMSAIISDGSDLTLNLNNPNDPNSAVMFSIARPIEVNRQPPVPNGLIIASSPASYIETDLQTLAFTNQTQFDIEEDFAGSVTLAAWADNPATGARIVLTGDDDWVTNQRVGAPLGNSILFTNVITWLTGFGEQVTFAPTGRATNLPLIFISPAMLDNIGLVTVVIMPGLALMIGLAAWMRRNRR